MRTALMSSKALMRRVMSWRSGKAHNWRVYSWRTKTSLCNAHNATACACTVGTDRKSAAQWFVAFLMWCTSSDEDIDNEAVPPTQSSGDTHVQQFAPLSRL